MTRDDIIRMARESRIDVYGLGTDHTKFVSAIERFAARIAAAVLDEVADMVGSCDPRATPKGIAAAIRARGKE